jgi:hypothetical protein
MLQIRTTVNNNYIYLDLYKNEPVFLNVSFSELQDITKKNSNFSRQFSLPGSKNNNLTFNFFYDLNAVPTNFNPNNKFEAELLWEGYEIMRGNIRLNSVSITNGEIIYSVTFYNQVGDLMANIGDKFLFDLDLADISHPYSDEVILQSNFDPNLFPITGTTNYSYQNGKTMWGLYNIGYEYISGNTLFDSATPLVQFTPVSSGLSYNPTPGNFDNSTTPVRDYYYKPAIQVKELYEQILKQAGYTVESKFFDTAYFKNYYLPLKFADETIYPKNAILPCYTVSASTIVRSGSPPKYVVNQSSGVTCNNFGWSANTSYPYQVVVPATNSGVYTYRFTFNAKATSACTNSTNLLFYISDGTIDTELYANLICDTVNSSQVSFEKQFIFTGNSEINFYFSLGNVQITDYKQEIIAGPRFIPTGSMIDYSIEFPENDYKQIDFITSVNKYFNFMVVPNPDLPQNLIIEPIIDYVGKGRVLDWTTKVDFDQLQNIFPTSSLINGTLEYSFRLDQDYANQNFNGQANRIFGNNKFLLNQQYKDSSTKFDYMFSSPIDITINNAYTSLITMPIMSKIKQVDISGTTQQTFVPYKILPKLLYRGVVMPNDNYGYYGTTAQTNPSCASSVNITVNTAGYVSYYTCNNTQVINEYSAGTYNITDPNCILPNTVGPSYSYPPYANVTFNYSGTPCGGGGPTANNYQYYYMNQTQMDRWTNTNRFTTYPFNYNNFSHYTNFRGLDKTNVTPAEFSFVANDLYNVYYKDYVDDILSEENKIYSAKIYLYPQDIKQLRGDERILINNTYFRLNKITNFNALEPSVCDVELVKLTKTYNPHPVQYYKFQSCPCVCISYSITNNSLIAPMDVSWTDCYGIPQTNTLSPGQGESICACENTIQTSGGDPQIVEIGTCTPDPTPSGSTLFYTSSDLMYHTYAYIGNYVKLYDDGLNYLGCFSVSLDDYNPTHDYKHYYFSSEYLPNLVGVYADCGCATRTQFKIVQQEPAVTPLFYYIGYDCNNLDTPYQFTSTGNTLNPSGVYKIKKSGTTQTICVTNITSDYLQLTDWTEIGSYVSCVSCLFVPTPTPTPTQIPCVCKSFQIDNNSLIGTTYVEWYDCNRIFQATEIYPNQGISICACNGTINAYGGNPVITDLGSCTPPPSPTPEPTPTPSCTAKGWLISTCSSTCIEHVCNCEFSGNIVVYSDCTVTDITSSSTKLYSNATLTTPYDGFFTKNGVIYHSTGTNVFIRCTIGQPC